MLGMRCSTYDNNGATNHGKAADRITFNSSPVADGDIPSTDSGLIVFGCVEESNLRRLQRL